MKIPWTRGNFISSFPERIKATLNKGVLVIKAGTKAYAPNGLDSNNNPVYTDYVLENDITAYGPSFSASSAYYTLFLSTYSGALINRSRQYICMGATADWTYSSNPTSDRQWWDTTNNRIKQTNDLGSTYSNVAMTLPIGIARCIAGYGCTEFIPFHFLGCMGNGIFLLPDVTFNWADGIDADGKPKIISNTSAGITFDNSITTITSNQIDKYYAMNKGFGRSFWTSYTQWVFGETEPTNASGVYWYDTLNNVNKWWQSSSSSWYTSDNAALWAKYTYEASTHRLSNFQPFTCQDQLSKYYM